MASDELTARVEACRADYESVVGRPFEHFFCPILLRDLPGGLCKGHVVPKAFGVCNAWVPQRSDVDNFFGSVAEAPFIAVVQDRRKPFGEVVADRHWWRRHRPRLEIDGVPIEHYVTKGIVESAPGHTPVKVVGDSGQMVCHLTMKESPSRLVSLDGSQFHLVVERDYRPAAIAAALKAAHLTMFKLLGYRHVFSTAGLFLAEILRSFYEQASQSADRDATLRQCFLPWTRLVLPMHDSGTAGFEGTVVDKILLGCDRTSGGFFALAVLVKAGSDLMNIFIPGHDSAIDTFFSFLGEPPPFINVRYMKYHARIADGESQRG